MRERMARRAGLLAGAAALAMTTAQGASAIAPRAASPAAVNTIGSPGGGDQYYPLAGNGGIDVDDYNLQITYVPQPYLPRSQQRAASGGGFVGRLDGRATITLHTTQKLARFDLDLSSRLDVRSVRVDGRRARATHTGGELVITPARTLDTGERVTVEVGYGHLMRRPPMLAGYYTGFIPTRDGAVVSAEPTGASTWFPCNDLPYDKATFTIAATVPRALVAVANGVPAGKTVDATHATYRWRAQDPMAPYLATLGIGNYRLSTTYVDGIPVINAIDRDFSPAKQRRLERQLAKVPAMMRYLSTQFGPYPFHSYGHIVDQDTQAGASLETQTRTLLMANEDDEATIAHELGHQWFGDAVALGQWRDIWLNESFATWAEWLWRASPYSREGRTLEASYRVAVRDMAGEWGQIVTDPGPDDLFADAVYERGGAALFRLQQRVGSATMTRILKSWYAVKSGEPARTAQFESMAARISGRDLDAFFHAWLDSPGRPPGA